MFDINDEKNNLLIAEYYKPNYRIIEYDNDSSVTVIYFSSHAIYFPNTEDEFIKRIQLEDRYEYMHFRFKNVKKEILFAIYTSNGTLKVSIHKLTQLTNQLNFSVHYVIQK